MEQPFCLVSFCFSRSVFCGFFVCSTRIKTEDLLDTRITLNIDSHECLHFLRRLDDRYLSTCLEHKHELGAGAGELVEEARVGAERSDVAESSWFSHVQPYIQ